MSKKLGKILKTKSLYSVALSISMIGPTDYVFEAIVFGANEDNSGIKTGVIQSCTLDSSMYEALYGNIDLNEQHDDITSIQTICGPLDLLVGHEPIENQPTSKYMDQIVSMALFPDYGGESPENMLLMEFNITHSKKSDGDFYIQFGWLSWIDCEIDGIWRRVDYRSSSDKFNLGTMRMDGRKLSIMFILSEEHLDSGYKILIPNMYDMINTDELIDFNSRFEYGVEEGGRENVNFEPIFIESGACEYFIEGDDEE